MRTAVPLAALLTATAQAQWVLIDDMEGPDTKWTGDGALVADPANPENSVYGITYGTNANDSEAYQSLGAGIADGTTGTLFFRVRSTLGTANTFNWVFGSSDVAAPEDNWGHYEGYANLDDLANDLPKTFNVRNQSAFKAVGTAEGDTWYNVWLVLDNDADTTTAYYNSGPGFPATHPSTLSASGPFRNGTASALATLYVRNNQAGATGYIDDVYLDTSGEVLTNPSFIDTDGDGMPDDFELQYTDPPSPTALDPGADLEDNGAGDGLTNLEEFNYSTNPLVGDTDGDTLGDGAEVDGSSNLYDAAATNPNNPDSDNDGLDDFEENGSLNTAFANAATNPNAADTDGDGIDDAYELANNTTTPTNTALDPNDGGGTEPSQAPGADRDGDGLTNEAEYDPSLGINTASPQTRADLADTDGDGYNDYAEDSSGFWVDSTQTGSNPLMPDTDGDGLLDGQEDYDLSVGNSGPGFPGLNTFPTNSDPNYSDTDEDGFSDFNEVTTAPGTDPDDALTFPAQPAVFTLVEDFEGDGMTIGQTIDGANGWTALQPSASLVADEPIAGSDQVAQLTRTSVFTGGIPNYKSLESLGLQILDGNTGTLFLQTLVQSHSANNSFGLSDVAAPAINEWGAHEAQVVAFTDRVIRVNDASATGGGWREQGHYQIGVWTNIWIVADNALDEVKIYWEAPFGQSGQIDVTPDTDPNAPFAFRNGTTEALLTVLLMVADGQAAGQSIYIDNIYVNPTMADLSTPATAKPITPPSTWGPIVVESASLNGTDFAMTVSGLNPNKSHDMVKGAGLTDFPGVVDSVAIPPGTTADFTDLGAITDPATGSPIGFYKVQEQP